ncbi:unnamed protein product [Sphagnum troendelagicum]|uniref:Gustatory receptor n=1 Tax=Sphagnum troendelagicum TaxID=128251 RepID=A0ABP0UQ75_9BRYO
MSVIMNDGAAHEYTECPQMSSQYPVEGAQSSAACAASSESSEESEKSSKLKHIVYFPEDGAVLPEVKELAGDSRGYNVGSSCKRLPSFSQDELLHFRSGLAWIGLDQSTPAKVALSWFLFFLFTFAVPCFNFSVVSCSNCDKNHTHPFELLVQYAESTLAAVSFLCLSYTLRTYGLRGTLLLDKMIRERNEVRQGYEHQLHTPFSLLAWILLPSFVIELSFRVWWYAYASISVPFIPNDPRLNMVLCAVGMLSWLYRTSIFLFMCVLFRLMCSLQILRLQGYNNLLKGTPKVSVILLEHLRIRTQLLTISHRFRVFLVLSLLTISFTLMLALFVMLGSAHSINFFRAGDLVVCTAVQLTGLVICLHGAAKITHRAQRIVSIVSQWHALATCTPNAVTASAAKTSGVDACQQDPAVLYGPAHPLLYNDSSDDLETLMPSFPCGLESPMHDMEAYQKRHALVTYLQHSRAGISLYGFVLDRTFLYSMSGVTVSLTLFILGKTIFA